MNPPNPMRNLLGPPQIQYGICMAPPPPVSRPPQHFSNEHSLMANGSLSSMAHITNYLAYTAKIHQHAIRCTWSSIMIYDREYRQLQATEGFHWEWITSTCKPFTSEKKPLKLYISTPRITNPNQLYFTIFSVIY